MAFLSLYYYFLFTSYLVIIFAERTYIHDVHGTRCDTNFTWKRVYIKNKNCTNNFYIQAME